MDAAAEERLIPGGARPVWMVVGGAGYIGAHVTRAFLAHGARVVVLDDMSSGARDALPPSVPCVEADARDSAAVHSAITRFAVTGVVHLAARKQARESIRVPLEYWDRNVGALVGVLDGIDGTSVSRFVLSSSCSVYGHAEGVTPESPLQPMSPYAQTKVASEWVLRAAAPRLGLSWTILRYFNVVGNDRFPMSRDRSTECLVPAAWQRMEEGGVPEVFGTDFQTPDGTALRDYVDVRDLATAHWLVASTLDTDPARLDARALNVATGTPASVKEVLGLLAHHSGRPLAFTDAGRRPGDPPAVWAAPSPDLLGLGWTPVHSLSDSVAAFLAEPDAR